MSDKKPTASKKTTDPQERAVAQAIPLLIGPADNTVPITVQRRTSVAPANAFRLWRTRPKHGITSALPGTRSSTTARRPMNS